MKGFGKRLLLTLLLLGLLAVTVSAASLDNCPGNCAHQAKIGTVHYDTLAQALSAAADGSTVTLLTDISNAAALNISKAITLDLGGKTLSGDNGAEEGLLNVSADFTLKNGTVTTDAGTCLLVVGADLTLDKTAQLIATGDTTALILQSAQTVVAGFSDDIHWLDAKISGVLENEKGYPAMGVMSVGDTLYKVTLDKTASITSREANALEFYGGGKLTVTGGTYKAKNHALALDVYDEMTLEASVTGGTFQTEGDSILVTQGEKSTAPSKFVTGGTFHQVPNKHIPTFCRIKDNGNGTYTVLSTYTLTFRPGDGTGTMAPVTVNCGSSVKLPACGFKSPANMDFAGWLIGGKVYAAGDSYTPTDDVIVTAQWKTHTHTGGKATCLKKAVCTGCGKTYGKLASHKLQHIAAYGPTCSASGMNSHDKCSVCGDLFVDGVAISARSVTIPPLGHSWETVEGTPATCQAEGLSKHQKCAECGQLRVDGETVKESDLTLPVSDHNWEEVAAVDATCRQAGMQAHQRCTLCGILQRNGEAVDAETLSVPMISHILSDWYHDETGHWKTCITCDQVFRQKAHTDSDLDGICDDCGYTMTVRQEAAPAPEEEGSFSWLFLIPIIAAVGIAVPLAAKKRK